VSYLLSVRRWDRTSQPQTGWIGAVPWPAVEAQTRTFRTPVRPGRFPVDQPNTDWIRVSAPFDVQLYAAIASQTASFRTRESLYRFDWRQEWGQWMPILPHTILDPVLWPAIAQLVGERTPPRAQDWPRGQTWNQWVSPVPVPIFDPLFWPAIAQLIGERTPARSQDWQRAATWEQPAPAPDVVFPPYTAADYPALDQLLRSFLTPRRLQEWLRLQTWEQLTPPHVPINEITGSQYAAISSLAGVYRTPLRSQEWLRLQQWQQAIEYIVGAIDLYDPATFAAMAALLNTFRTPERTRLIDLFRPEWVQPGFWDATFTAEFAQPFGETVHGIRWADIRSVRWPFITGLRWPDITEP
jgi:hypothetical protein